MSNETLGRGKRTVIKTPAIAAHDAKVQRDAGIRESRARNKKVNEEEEALQEEEEALEAMKVAQVTKANAKSKANAKGQAVSKSAAMSTAAKLVSKSNAGSKSVSTSASRVASGNAQKNDISPEEAANIAAVFADEAEVNRYVNLIHYRDFKPIDYLKTLDLDELQTLWKAGEGSAPAAKPKETAKKAAAKAPAKTPSKKVKSSAQVVSKITMIGSPLNALNQAKSQAERAAAPSPLAPACKRGLSTDHSEGGQKRARAESVGDVFSNPTAASNSKLPPKKPAARAKHPKSQPPAAPSRSSSSAPKVTVVRAASSQLPSPSRRPAQPKPKPKPVTASWGEDTEVLSGLDDPSEGDEDVFKPDQEGADEGMGENEGGDMGEGEAEDEVTQPKAKGKGKKKATMGQFTRDEGKLVDEAYAQIVLLLATEDFCPLNDAYDEMIARGWIAAIKARKLSLDDWPLGADHEEVIRGRIHSLRGRIRDRVLDAVISVFGLSLDTMDSVEEIKARAGELIPDLFHRDPKIKSDTASQYQHQIISRAIYTSFFHGLKPVGLKFKDAFNPMPVETIGYMAGLIEYLLGRLKADGMYSKQLRVGISGSNVRGPAMTHLDNLDLFQECLPNLFLVQLQERTFSLVMAHITKAEQRRQSRSAASRLTAQDFDHADELSPAQMAEMRAQFGHGSETKGRRHVVERASRAASSAMDADEVQAALDRVTPGSSRDSPVPSAHIDHDVDMPYAQETAMDEGEHEHGEDDREGSAGGEGGEGNEEGDERDEEGGEDDEEGGEGDEEGGEGGEEGDADNAGDVGDMGNVDEADVGEKDNAGEDGEQEREDKGQVNNSADDDDFSSVVLGTDGGKGDLVRDGHAFMPLGDYDSDLTEPSDGEGAKEGAKSSPKGKQGKGAKALGVGDPGSDAVGDGLEVGKDDEGGPIKSRAGGEVGSGATQAKAVGAPEDGVKPLKTSAVAPPTQASQPVESYSKPTKDNGGTGAARTSRAAKTKAAAIITEKIKGTKAKSGAAGGGSGGTGKGKQRAI